ncbi:MAG: DUF2975 domain-containing protein [Clostridia bacterium]|nr:DUF2975 domain-containing protein [Clostridia bacterium]NCC76699.1 DUF2975 domain-containing protein [Clostridia bacterium]
MQLSSTLFLKVAVFLIGLPVLAACIFLVPGISNLVTLYSPDIAFLRFVFLAGVYGSAVIFFQALYQAFGLLDLIDRSEAFSAASVRCLKRIKRSAVMISILYIAQLPLLYLMAEGDDAPGLIVLGLLIIFASLVIAVFAAVLERLLNDAILLKSEVDLTV